MLDSLVLDIDFDAFFSHPTHRFGEVTIGPQAVAPEEFFKLWILCSDYLACPTLHKLDGMGDSLFRRQLYEQVDMVNLDVHFNDVPLVHLSTLSKQLVQPPREWAS